LIPTGLTVRLPSAAANRQEKSHLFSVLREQEWRELVARAQLRNFAANE
jgi:hypothetical protein